MEKKPNPPSISDVLALNEAKAMRAQKKAAQAKSIRRMAGDGVPHAEIAQAMRVSRSFVQGVLAQAEVKS